MQTYKTKVACIVGARPNFVKIAPIMRALIAAERFEARLLHTGQHYDVAMNEAFFEELEIPRPDANLEVGSGSHTEQTAAVMLKLEAEFIRSRPDLVVVVGDVNSTLAASLVSAKMQIPVAHVEAGLRSRDLGMPEEINRLLTDRLSSLLFITEPSARQNLEAEGMASDTIHFVGNVMIDTLYHCLRRAVPASVTIQETGASEAFLNATGDGYAFATMHRASNVDSEAQLSGLLRTLVNISRQIPIVFAIHPRTKAKIEQLGLASLLKQGRIHSTPPLSYLRALGLIRGARVVLTDSGGIQEETTALMVPCLTMRDNTERPITVEIGTNEVVGTSHSVIEAAVARILAGGEKQAKVPEYWDGRAAERIVDVIARVTSGMGM